MYHPLLDDLTKIKDADLDSKILDLSKKYHIAAKYGSNEICSQIVIILESLKDERSLRYKKNLKNTIKNDDNDLDSLINVE